MLTLQDCFKENSSQLHSTYWMSDTILSIYCSDLIFTATLTTVIILQIYILQTDYELPHRFHNGYIKFFI